MMTLYIKKGCPWCDMAEEWLRGHGYRHTIVEVLSSAEDFSAMVRLSGQSKAPVLVTEDGRVLADFGPEELPAFLEREGRRPSG